MNAAARNKSTPPTPPEKGSFPLDHDGECVAKEKDYMLCLRKERSKKIRRENIRKWTNCSMKD